MFRCYRPDHVFHKHSRGIVPCLASRDSLPPQRLPYFAYDHALNKNMSTTKELERAELHKTIWRIANDLRGSVDGWDFKTYVLGMLFYRFVSENLTSYLNEQERKASNDGFNYAALSDDDAESGRAETVKEASTFCPPNCLSMCVSGPGATTT